MNNENGLLYKRILIHREIKVLEEQSSNFVTYHPEKKPATATAWYDLKTGEIYGVGSRNPRPFDPVTNKGTIDTVGSVLVLYDPENNCAKGELGEERTLDHVLEIVLRRIEEARKLRILEKWEKAVKERGILSVL